MPSPSFWEQFGPWCVLAVLLLFAIGFALKALGMVIWKMYNRMADALDSQHATEIQQHKDHAGELKLMTERLLSQAKEQTVAMQQFTAGIDQNTAATKSLEATIKANGCRFQKE